MSYISQTPHTIRQNFLVQIARVLNILTVFGTFLFAYQGITTSYWPYFLMIGAFGLTFIVTLIIVRSPYQAHPVVGTWHLLFAISLTALLLSAVHPNPGSGIQAAILIIISIIVVRSLPTEQMMRGVTLGVIASLASGLLTLYSPFQQIIDPIMELIITWFARIAVVAFLVFTIIRFRRLTLTSKLLISFLGVVVLISMAISIVVTTTTTNALTDRIGQQLRSVAEARGLVIGDYVNGQVEVLQTFALDETIRQSVRAANALKPTLESVQELDDQWQQAVVSNTTSSLINSRLSNSLSNDLRAFQALAPEHIEVFVTDRVGALVSAANITSDYYQADEEWWVSTYQDGIGNVYIGQPEFDESAEALSILIAVPIYDTRQGGLIGVLRTTISIENLVSVLREPIGETGEVDILFPDGAMFDTREGEFEVVYPDSMMTIQDLADQIYLRALFKEKDSILAQGPVQSQALTAKVNKMGWYVIALQNTDEALAPVREQVRLVSFFATIMAGLAALASLVISQRLAQPIINLTETANRVSSGNLDARARIESQDETGQLAETFNNMTAQLKETLVRLEERVAERTAELVESTHQLQKRAGQFEAIAQLARTITSIQELDILLPRITRLVSQQFGFYHVGLFLLDESQQYAVLSAANSAGGERMLARKHRLKVGTQGIVGYVTSTANPRIALDTGTDAVYFDNPDLPDTRSEMALPLCIGSTVIGALDVQSTEPNAFTEEDVEVLSILADEVSIAVENARLFEEAQRSLADAQSAFGKFTQEAWQKISKSRKVIGYELSGTTIRSIEERVKENGSALSVPIKLRNKVIGEINISLPEKKALDADELDITQILANRVGVAIESATLLEYTQSRAERERLVTEITAKMRSTNDPEVMIQTTLNELKIALGATKVQLIPHTLDASNLRSEPANPPVTNPTQMKAKGKKISGGKK